MTDEQITAALGDLQRDRLDGEQSCYMDWYEAALLELRDTRAQLRKLAQHVEMSFPEEVDARDWARAFVQRARSNPEFATDEANMVGWFANAIMRGYDDRAHTSLLPAAPGRTKMESVCGEIRQIMTVYHQQELTEFGVDTPGGLEHMGDVWALLMRWDRALTEEKP